MCYQVWKAKCDHLQVIDKINVFCYKNKLFVGMAPVTSNWSWRAVVLCRFGSCERFITAKGVYYPVFESFDLDSGIISFLVPIDKMFYVFLIHSTQISSEKELKISK